jgi:hypothetical protein
MGSSVCHSGWEARISEAASSTSSAASIAGAGWEGEKKVRMERWRGVFFEGAAGVEGAGEGEGEEGGGGSRGVAMIVGGLLGCT